MPIGVYQVSAVKQWFKRVLMENVQVTIGIVTDVEVSLAEGALEEVVVVANPDSYRIDVSSSESGMAINSDERA